MNVDQLIQLKDFIGNKPLNGMKIKKWLKDHTDIKTELNKILIQYPNLTSISNIIYCLIHHIDMTELKCEVCGKFIKVNHITQLSHFCSAKCRANSKRVREKTAATIAKNPEYYKNRQRKITETCLEKYGVSTVTQAECIKNKIRNTINTDSQYWDKRNLKSKETCLKKYGVCNPAQLDSVKNLIKSNNLKKYGVTNPNKLEVVKEKIKTTCQQRYSIDCQFQRKDIIKLNNDKSWNRILTWSEYVIPMFTRDEYTGYNQSQIYKWKCTRCGEIFEQQLYHTKIADISTFVPRCPKCYPLHVCSKKEKELVNFCKQYFFDVQENNRQLIKPLELDIVIPEIKLAIEFNGIWYHSIEFGTELGYHLHKTKLCEQIGYRLIHIWENKWMNNKQDIFDKLITVFKNTEIIDKTQLLDHSWYSTKQCENMEFIPPNIFTVNNLHLENCGFFKPKTF